MNQIEEIIKSQVKKAIKSNDLSQIEKAGNAINAYYETLSNCLTKKTCSKCKRLLPDSHFNKRVDAYKELQNTCKPCFKPYQDAHYAINKDSILNKRVKYRETHQKEIIEGRSRYNSSEYGKQIIAIKGAKSRGLEFNLLYPIPLDWDTSYYSFHHINDIDVVALPKHIHSKHTGKHHKDKMLPCIKEIYGKAS